MYVYIYIYICPDLPVQCKVRRVMNFAATPDESRGKFAGACNPPTIRNKSKSKTLRLS